MNATASPPRKRRPAPTPEQALASSRAITKRTKIGRPLSYHPRLCEEAIKLGHKGKHWAAIATAFGVDRATLYKWQADFPEFSDAMNRARTASQAWWENKAQSKLGAKHFQANAARLVMTAQFQDYRDIEKGQANQGLDLGALVGAISQGVAAATLQAGQPGDRAKVINAEPAERDAPLGTLDVVAPKR